MSVEFLSPDQVARYGGFVTVPSPGELEQFFRLDAAALEAARSKRRDYNKVGWTVQWGTVRMLGTFLADPVDVPTAVAEFAAEQLDVADSWVYQGLWVASADPARPCSRDPSPARLHRVCRQ